VDIQIGEHVAAPDVEPEQEHAEHAREEHQHEAAHDLSGREDRVSLHHIRVAAVRETCSGVHKDGRRRASGAGGLRRNRCQPCERNHQPIQQDWQQQHRARPSQHSPIVAADERHQRESDECVGRQDVTHPDQQCVDEADEQQSDQSALEQARRVPATSGGALHEHREADAEQQRKQRIELRFDQEQDQKVGGGVPLGEREREVMIRREEREP
jgi:hypothetical protein